MAFGDEAWRQKMMARCLYSRRTVFRGQRIATMHLEDGPMKMKRARQTDRSNAFYYPQKLYAYGVSTVFIITHVLSPTRGC